MADAIRAEAHPPDNIHTPVKLSEGGVEGAKHMAQAYAPAVREGNGFEALVQSAIHGDSDALLGVCQTIAKGVLFRALRVIGNNNDAEDVAQEAMLRICAGIQDLKSPKAFYVWLNTIITNETNRFFSRNSNAGTLVNIDDFTDEFIEENKEFLPQECIVMESDRRAVIEMIDRLPAQQRKAVSLYYYDGLTLEEAAGIMGVSQPRVSRCLMFARENIKSGLAAGDGRPDGAAYGTAFAPTGTLIAEVMRRGAEQFTPINPLWLQETIGSCAEAVGNMGAETLGIAASAHTASALGSKLKAAAAITSTVAVGTMIGLAQGGETDTLPADCIADANYSIAFTGGSGLCEHVNPAKAVALVDTPYGAMEAIDWQIAAEGGGDALYCGEGGTVSDALSELRMHGERGAYVLRFRMGDAVGNIYTLSRNFAVER